MKYRSARLVLLWLFFATICFTAVASNEPIMRVTFLDVEQGDCIIVRSAEKTIMIDVGDDNRNVVQRYVIPYLRKEGITHIDQAIITHPHRDHFGGFTELIDEISIGEFYYSTDSGASEEGEESEESEDPERSPSTASVVYTRFYDKLTEKTIPYVQAKLGDKLDWGKGIKAEVIHAADRGDQTPHNPTGRNVNNDSIVIKATVGKIVYLLTGDAERGAEAEMIARYNNKLKADVLKAGHHGSKTSSTHAFLDMVKPKYGVISVGKRNSFNHPSQETLDKYAYNQMTVFRTDIDGTIESHTDGKTITFITADTPLEFVKKPNPISVTANSITLQWETNREGTTAIFYGENTYDKNKEAYSAVKVHTATLTGLKPDTTYRYRAITKDPRDSSHYISHEGTVKTKAGSGVPTPVIAKISTNFPQLFIKYPFKTIIPVKNPSDKAAKNVKLTLYHSSMAERNILGKANFTNINAGVTIEAIIKTQIDWVGDTELIAVLEQGNEIIDTASVNLPILDKQIFVDASHGNKDYFTGQFAGMKMNLGKQSGFSLRSVHKGIDYNLIKNAFILIIPHPTTDFTNTELQALKKFTDNGGSLLLYGQSDYKNTSNPQMLNKVLEAIGSTIRFNDDQVCHPEDNIGPPWRFFVRNYPTPEITKDADRLLFRSACSLINHKMTALKKSETVSILAEGDEKSYNYNADDLDDAFLYENASGAIIPLVAAEDLGLGRVACVGEKLYLDTFYSNPAGLSTIDFNRNIIDWLGTGKFKTLKEIARYVDQLDKEVAKELRTERYDVLFSRFMTKTQSYLNEDDAALNSINEMLNEYDSDSVQLLKRQVNDMHRFNNMHRAR